MSRPETIKRKLPSLTFSFLCLVLLLRLMHLLFFRYYVGQLYLVNKLFLLLTNWYGSSFLDQCEVLLHECVAVTYKRILNIIGKVFIITIGVTKSHLNNEY